MFFNQRNTKRTATLRTICTGDQPCCVYATNTCDEQEDIWCLVAALTALRTVCRGSAKGLSRSEGNYDNEIFDDRITVMHRLTTGIRSEKCVVRRFRCFADVVERTCTNRDSIAYCTPRL